MADERAEIEALVRRVVLRTLGAGDAPGASGAPDTGRKRPLLDEAAVRETPNGATLTLAPNTIITPLARQAAQERRITLQVGPANPPPTAAGKPGGRRIALGADHGGYELKEALKATLAAEYEIIDCGTQQGGGRLPRHCRGCGPAGGRGRGLARHPHRRRGHRQLHGRQQDRWYTRGNVL